MQTNNPPPNVMIASCSSRQALELVADKWTALVIFALEGGTKRFSQLRREIEGVSQKMLTQTLRSLERDGLVLRVLYPAVPPIVEYSLTELGLTLVEPMQALRQWAETYYVAVGEARTRYDTSATSINQK